MEQIKIAEMVCKIDGVSKHIIIYSNDLDVPLQEYYFMKKEDQERKLCEILVKKGIK